MYFASAVSVKPAAHGENFADQNGTGEILFCIMLLVSFCSVKFSNHLHVMSFAKNAHRVRMT